MSNFVPVMDHIIAQAIGDTSTTQKLPLGTIVRARDVGTTAYGEGVFIYLKGVASTVLGSVVIFSPDDFTTALLTAGATGLVAVAMSINVASQYGWYQLSGKAVVKAATVVDNGAVYACGTAGSVDDNAVAGDRVMNATFGSADGTPSAGLAECEIQYPVMDDSAANAIIGIGSGYKIARGTAAALDGSNPTPIATGLATIVAASVQLRGTAAPGDNTSVLTTDYTGSDGTLNVYAWKNTGGSDPTLVASTGTETFDWVAIGT